MKVQTAETLAPRVRLGHKIGNADAPKARPGSRYGLWNLTSMGLGRSPLTSDTEKLIRPVSRATLPQEIVKALTDLIMKRVWKPGDLIPSEKELAIRFQVGRSTIREAVKSLVVLGVLEARAGEGSFVREPTSELLSGAFRWGLLLSEGNLDDFVDVRVLIEVECARRAAANKTEELVSQLDTDHRGDAGGADGPQRVHG